MLIFLLILLSGCLLLMTVITVIDYRKNRSYLPLPSSPPVPLSFEVHKMLSDLGAGRA